MDEVMFTIDGAAVRARPGQSVLKAAQAAGIHIPHLCAFKDLVPHGSCRICSVRCNGRIQAACVQTAVEGMVVENDTAELREFRRAILDMLFVEGNHFCMFCEKSGMCELQALAYTELRVTDAVVASCPVGALMRKRVGFQVPVGERRFDRRPIGAAIETAETVGKEP
jgi:NADH dehydrogenase/NADH:ubiquinone oxidoreductase subunit G